MPFPESDMKLELARPDRKFQESFLAGFRECHAPSERLAWLNLGESFPLEIPEQDFSFFLSAIHERETRPPLGFVPTTIYWAISGHEVVGRISLRHELNAFLRREGGHIGYVVRPHWRIIGVATAMLGQVLATEKARAIG
jgi:predicted acetyltransferase